jgi:hypothetical protein
MAGPIPGQWRSRDNFSKTRHQEVLDGANMGMNAHVEGKLETTQLPHGRIIRNTHRSARDKRIPGIVWDTGPNGESDFADERYWVALAFPSAQTEGEEAFDDRVAVVPDSDGGPVPSDIVLAVSLLELPLYEDLADPPTDPGTHRLQKGQAVELFAMETRYSTTTGVRWGFAAAVAALPTPQYAEMVLKAVTQNQLGFGFIHTHALL